MEAGFKDDVATVDALIGVLRAHHPRLVLVNLASVDDTGHSGIWRSYTGAIQIADSLVYVIWKYIESDPFYAGKTYLFVTCDHGRHDDAHGGFQDHGDGCEGCRHILFLALGPRILADHTIADPYALIDICPTFGALLGFETPQAKGRVI